MVDLARVLRGQEREVGQDDVGVDPAGRPPGCDRLPEQPRSGANSSETSTSRLITTTIAGPVGIRSTRPLRIVPPTPASAPNAALIPTIRPSRSVHCRAGRRRRHDHRAHQDDADRLEPDHDRDHDQRRQPDVEPADAHAEAGREVGVEAEELELLPEQQQRQEGQHADRRHRLDVADDQRGRLPEQETVEPRLRGVRPRWMIVSRTRPTPKKLDRMIARALS
jgi:hypothetical protein